MYTYIYMCVYVLKSIYSSMMNNNVAK